MYKDVVGRTVSVRSGTPVSFIPSQQSAATREKSIFRRRRHRPFSAHRR